MTQISHISNAGLEQMKIVEKEETKTDLEKPKEPEICSKSIIIK